MELFTSLDGRIGRGRFWLGTLALIAIALVLGLAGFFALGLSLLPGLVAMMPSVSTDLDLTAAADAVNAATAAMAEMAPKVAWFSVAMIVILAYPTLAIGLKRRHDRNNKGIDFVIYYVLSTALQVAGAFGIGSTLQDINGVHTMVPSMPFAVFGMLLLVFGIYLLIVLGFLRGTTGPNAYGPDPLRG